MSYNRKALKTATNELGKAKAPAKPKDIITDPMGQWKYPGQNTRIPGNDITMQGVDYPVWAQPNVGQPQMMYPGIDYQFPGADYVDEFPQMQEGGVSPLEGNLISKVIMNRNRGVDFVDRAYALGANPGTPIFNVPDDEEFGSWMSHKMATGEDDNGQTWMFPTVMNPNDEAIVVPNQYADYISSTGYKNATGMIPEEDYIEAELSDDEIEKYRKGGYIVEDISVPSLTQAQKGIIISDPKEYAYRKNMYNDSLNLYKENAKWQPARDKALQEHIKWTTSKGTVKKSDINKVVVDNKSKSIKLPSSYKYALQNNIQDANQWNKINKKIKPTNLGRTYAANKKGEVVIDKYGVPLVFEYPVYKKPVQAIYKPGEEPTSYVESTDKKSISLKTKPLQKINIESNLQNEVISSTYSEPKKYNPTKTAYRSQTIMEPDPDREGKYRMKESRQVPYATTKMYRQGDVWENEYAPRVMYTDVEGNETEERPKLNQQKKGGSLKKYSRSLEATNKVFHDSPLLKKAKSKKKKIFNPKSNYFDVGGIPNLPLREGRKAYKRLSYTDNDRMAMAEEGGFLPQAQYAGQTPFVHPNAGATQVLFQKSAPVKPNSKYDPKAPVNYQAKLKPIAADNTRTVVADEALAAVQNAAYMKSPEYKAKQKAEKEAQAKFEKKQWANYNKMSLGEKVLDRTNAALNQPLVMASNLLMGEQAYIPGMAEGLGGKDINYDKYLKATGQSRGLSVNDVFNTVNPGNWGGHAGREYGKGNYVQGTTELGLGLLGLKGAPISKEIAKKYTDKFINIKSGKTGKVEDDLVDLWRIQEKGTKPMSELAAEGKLGPMFKNEKAIKHFKDREEHFGQWFTKDKADLDWYKKDREFVNPEIINLKVPKSKLNNYSNYNKSLSSAPNREFVIPHNEQSLYKTNLNTKMGFGFGMDMSKYEIKNPDYFTQLLDTYDNKTLSSTNKKFYKDLIGSVKKQNGLVTERQYNELQRLKTGNFNFGKKGYKDGGSFELDLTPNEIQAYIDAGYTIEDID